MFGLGTQAATPHLRGIDAQVAALAVLDKKCHIIEGIEQAFQRAQVNRAERPSEGGQGAHVHG